MKTSTRFLTVTSILSLILATSGFAATSGTLNLSGVVPAADSIVVTPNGTNNTTLSITGGEAAKSVAGVAETSNNPTGYKIKMSSANGGKLQRTASDYTAYQISYDGGTYGAPGTTPAQVKSVSSLTALTTNTSDVKVNVTAKPTALAGTYSDVVTFSIEANP